MQKFSSFGRKKKQTKIRHRMVMLEGLQLFYHQRDVRSSYVPSEDVSYALSGEVNTPSKRLCK